jgi:hypothetical protein
VKTYPIVDESTGVMFAFEVDNAYISLSMIVRLLNQVAGLENVRPCAPFRRRDHRLANFTFRGQEYAVVEPFGDNSRYWIGPTAEDGHFADVRAIESRFKDHLPSPLRLLVGDIVTLRFLRG